MRNQLKTDGLQNIYKTKDSKIFAVFCFVLTLGNLRHTTIQNKCQLIFQFKIHG